MSADVTRRFTNGFEHEDISFVGVHDTMILRMMQKYLQDKMEHKEFELDFMQEHDIFIMFCNSISQNNTKSLIKIHKKKKTNTLLSFTLLLSGSVILLDVFKMDKATFFPITKNATAVPASWN